MDKPLIVVLGIGEMGLVHAMNLSKDRRIRLGLASTRPEALKKAQIQTSADKIYSSYQSVLEDSDVTGVVISTPPDTHPKLIEMCTEHNKHIFSEKPLGNDSDSIRRLIKGIEREKVLLMTGFMRRFDIGYMQAYDKVYNDKDNKNIGRINLIKCTSGDADYPEKYRRDTLEYALLKDLAVHDIDLIRWFNKDEIKSVYAIIDSLTYPDLKERKDGDVGLVICELQNGCKAMVHLSRSLKFGYDVTTELFCLNGCMKIGMLTNGNEDDIEILQNQYQSKLIDSDFRVRFEQAFENEMKAFVDLIVDVIHNDYEHALKLMADDHRYADIHDGLMATIVAEAMIQSVQKGLPITIDYNKV